MLSSKNYPVERNLCLQPQDGNEPDNDLYQSDNDCYKLIPTYSMHDGNELSLDTLESIGINRHTQFKELDEKQEEYLSRFFN